MEENMRADGLDKAMQRKRLRVLRILAGGGHIRQIPTLDAGTEGAERLYGLFKDKNRLSLPTQKLETALVRNLLSIGLATQVNSTIQITPEGREWIRWEKSGGAQKPMRDQKLDVQDIGTRIMMAPSAKKHRGIKSPDTETSDTETLVSQSRVLANALKVH